MEIKKLRKLSPNRNVLAEYDLPTQTAMLYMPEIRSEAEELGSDVHDLTTMVIYHEEAHHLHAVNKLSLPNEEQLADEYALRKFVRVHGRKPNVVRWKGGDHR